MDLTIKSIPNKFYIGESPQNIIGEIDYHVDEKNRIVVTHTYVNRDYRGQGLALQLLIKVIEIAEKNKQFIVPLCGFAAKVITENKQYSHLLEDKKNAGEGSNCDWRV